MALYKGRIPVLDLEKKIEELLTANGYEQISSNLDQGYVFRSLGISGEDEFFIRIVKNASNPHQLSIYRYNSYVPGQPGINGTFGGGNGVTVQWTTSTAKDYELDYHMNVTKDRFILMVEPEQGFGGTPVIMGVGLPKRYDSKDKGGRFAGIWSAGSSSSTSKVFNAAYGRDYNTNKTYSYYTYVLSTPMTTGGDIFLSPIIIGDSVEGPRGEMEDIYAVATPDTNNDFRHGDTFVRNGETYMLVGGFYGNYGSLPSNWYAIKIKGGK